MYYVYTTGLNDFTIKLSKIGVNIRPLNSSEKKEIIKIYNDVYSKKTLFNACIREHGKNFSKYRKLRMQLDTDDKIIETLFREWRFYDLKPVFHKSIMPLFDNIMVIDIDENELKNYIEPESFRLFLKQFFSLSYIYENDCDLPKKHDSLTFVSRRYNLSSNDELIIKYMINNFETSSSHIFVSSRHLKNYCNTMQNFFSHLTVDKIFRFIEIMEMYNLTSGFKPNLLINNILVIESLVAKDDKDLAKNFVHKTSLFLINGNKKYHLKECICILDYLYNVRSDIVHGNTSKLFNDFSKLSDKLPSLDYPQITRQSKMHKRNMIIDFSYSLSYSLLNDVLKLWLANPDELDFIKEC